MPEGYWQPEWSGPAKARSGACAGVHLQPANKLTSVAEALATFGAAAKASIGFALAPRACPCCILQIGFTKDVAGADDHRYPLIDCLLRAIRNIIG